MEKKTSFAVTPVYIVSSNIISPLGFTTTHNFENLKNKITGVKKIKDLNLSTEPLCAAAIQEEKINSEFEKLNSKTQFTRFEKLAILSIEDALKQNTSIDISSAKTLLILSTTKGNIDLLDAEQAKRFPKKRIYIWETANVIAKYFDNPNTPIVISNACISGVLALIYAKRILAEKSYSTVVVCGADMLSEFVVSGFNSFKAISSEIAKPYDAKRDGISLGEGCGTMILTNDKSKINNHAPIVVNGGASSNDANHISGPSRTGDGLLVAINNTLNDSKTKPASINYICGHGTATVFNDDMESIAIHDAQLAHVPMNSLKSYFGHTLGAAGIIESIIGVESMKQNTVIGTYNFNVLGVTKPITIIKDTTYASINNCLKTSAGFGGCNAAILFSKI